MTKTVNKIETILMLKILATMSGIDWKLFLLPSCNIKTLYQFLVSVVLFWFFVNLLCCNNTYFILCTRGATDMKESAKGYKRLERGMKGRM